MQDEITDIELPNFDTAMPVALPRTRTKRDHVMQFFAYSDLSANERELAAPFSALAEKIHADIDPNPERAKCLEKLLEARDSCLRAAKAQDPL